MHEEQWITPRRVVGISQAEFAKSFSECIAQVDDGVIFRVAGNDQLKAIREDFVKASVASGNFGLFRKNTPALYSKQLVQKAAFSGLPIHHDALIDSTLRLRRTVGAGAFVGPHLDVHEDLPMNALNFWISFSSLEREETIQFLPPGWVLDGIPVGHFKAGVYVDKKRRILPFEKLVKSAVSSAIEPGEYFVFKSGRTAHCSPFFVKGERITADQRMLLAIDGKELNFACRPDYYPFGWLDRFDGEKPVNEILREYWSGDGLARHGAAIAAATTPQRPIDRMLEVPALAHDIAKSEHISAQEPGIKEVLSLAHRSVSLRLALLETTAPGADRDRVCEDLVELVPESPHKTYTAVARSASAPVVRAIWHRASERGGIVGGIVATAAFELIRLLEALKGTIPERVRAASGYRLCWILWRQLHGSGANEYVEVSA